jgi:hypothetical protein
MNKNTFRHYAEAYGAQIERWPTEVQADALQSREAPWARDILSEAARTDALFGGLAGEVAPGRVGASIAAVSARIGSQKPGWRELWRRFALQGAGVATAGVLGVYVAVSTSSPTLSETEAMSQLFALTLSLSDSAFMTGLGDLS